MSKKKTLKIQQIYKQFFLQKIFQNCSEITARTCRVVLPFFESPAKFIGHLYFWKSEYTVCPRLSPVIFYPLTCIILTPYFAPRKSIHEKFFVLKCSTQTCIQFQQRSAKNTDKRVRPFSGIFGSGSKQKFDGIFRSKIFFFNCTATNWIKNRIVIFSGRNV